MSFLSFYDVFKSHTHFPTWCHHSSSRRLHPLRPLPSHSGIHSFIHSSFLEFEFHSMHWNRNIAKRRLTIDDTIQIEKNVPPLLARRVELNLSNTSTILLVEINGNTVHMAATIVECISRRYWKRWPASNPSLVCFGKW